MPAGRSLVCRSSGGDGEVGFGIRDPAHIVRFAERTAQALDPTGFGDYEQAKQTLDARLDISIDDDLIGQLTGDLAASAAPDGGFGVRAEPANRLIDVGSPARSRRWRTSCPGSPRARASAT